ncbi:SH3 domain-containing protein [Peribacillus sp. NPDC097225]|uniref:SH3 domain-containing protein n=1 Tax=Peribacillus sp. NPDC097225 TaxID=3364400 RepID=UPI00380B1F13
MKRRIITLFAATLVFLTIFSYPHATDQVQAASKTAKVTASSLHIREQPKTTAKSLGLIKKGKEVTISSQKSGWSKIKYGKLTGWVSTTYLDELGYVTASSLVLRKSNNTSSKSLATLPKGTAVEIKSTKGNWLQIYVSSKKKTGWVSKTYISSSKPTATAKPAAVSTTKYYVTASSLYVRKSANTTSKKLATINKGAAVTYIKKSGNWANVKTASGVTGWASLTYLSKKKPTASPSAVKETTYYVTAAELYVRKSGNSKADKVTTLKKGEAVTLYEEKDKWGRIKTASGKTGWASLTYLAKTKPKETKPVTTTPPKVEAPIKEEPVKTKPTKYYVISDSLNIRNGPSATNKIIGAVDRSDSVIVTETQGDWGKVETQSGLVGWASLTYLSKTKPSDGFKGKVIVLDPGHGGSDPGASGKNNREKDLTLSTAKKLKAKLEEAGAKVVMTRTGDTYPSLSKRVEISQANKPDVFISIHYNAGPSSANGIETFYLASNVNEKELAQTVQAEIIKETKLRDRGAKTGNFQVIRDNKQAAILLELGFISNLEEEKLIATSAYQDTAVTGIFNGLKKYFNLF